KRVKENAPQKNTVSSNPKQTSQDFSEKALVRLRLPTNNKSRKHKTYDGSTVQKDSFQDESPEKLRGKDSPHTGQPNQRRSRDTNKLCIGDAPAFDLHEMRQMKFSVTDLAIPSLGGQGTTKKSILGKSHHSKDKKSERGKRHKHRSSSKKRSKRKKKKRKKEHGTLGKSASVSTKESPAASAKPGANVAENAGTNVILPTQEISPTDAASTKSTKESSQKSKSSHKKSRRKRRHAKSSSKRKRYKKSRRSKKT
ncbi:unnamed protein product, partial [Ixodes persulcatus]